MIPFVSEEYTISDNVVLTIFDIETIDERTRAVLDENFVLICEGNTGSSLSTVKTRVRNLYSTKNPEWIMGATAEFFVPLYIRLTDFIGLTKANRYKYCLDTEIYTEKLNIIVNSKLRNAIGHNDVAYNTKSQKITYIPNPRDRSRKEEIYLLEFENEAIRLFQGLLVVDEYIYRLRQLELKISGFATFGTYDRI